MQILLLQQTVQKHVHGNSATATKLQTARTISLSGAVKGSASFDGTKNVTISTTQDNIAILTGKVNIKYNAGDYGYSIALQLNYPSGYNKNNCIVIGFGTKRNGATDYGYSYGTLAITDGYSGANLRTSVGKAITLKTNEINLAMFFNFGNAISQGSAFDIDYQVVLMKIA